ncbi:MAG: molybdopterin oxidoreductase family protein [Burkholderiaceae bacterium]
MTTPTVPASSQPIKFDTHAKQTVAHTTCYMCACRCGIQVTLEEGKVRFIQGTAEHPVNQGVLCAKGSAGIMKQYSPGKLQQPLRRKKGSARGSGEFEAISWDEALDELTKRLQKIRETDPRKLAFFTGRDQMQALTGLWAQQFGTPNWAAHGGFCSVNMAAAGLYSIGYSFWEFGAPDWDRAKYFMLWGVAEDHSSNPIKIGLEKLKRHGAKFVSVNPVRTGYSAIADEWVPIRPGTDGLLALAMVHVLLSRELFDWEFLVRTTNAPWLVIDAPGTSQDGLFLRNAEGQPLVFDQGTGAPSALAKGVKPALFGRFDLAGTYEGKKVQTVMSMMAERYLDPSYAPEAVAEQCGVPAAQIEKLTLEMAAVAFEETIELPIAWTDVWGNQHDKVVGRPVAMFAMRGISAHSNGFQTCRALHLIQMLLGALDGPGNFRSKAPFPRAVPPPILPENDAELMAAASKALAKPPLGFPTRPEELAIDEDGKPLRLDKAYSWESPIAAHGMMHMVIHNAVKGDPYPIDTLILFMANMAWNSAMNTEQTQQMLTAKGDDGNYKIPYIAVSDAFDSETVRYADLVLPDTTYLERYDAISILDRPISEPDAVIDAIRHPVVALDRDVRPWQEVLVDLAVRLEFPAFVNEEGKAKYTGYNDFIVNWEKAPGMGFLGGFRGKDGNKAIRGEPNQNQWDDYIKNKSFFEWKWPDDMQYNRGINQAYLEKSTEFGFIPAADPIVMQIYSEPLQKFRLAGQGLYDGPRPPDSVDQERLTRYFDPLPVWYGPLETTGETAEKANEGYDMHAITQRPMVMYHSWDSQNAWLRQILGENYLYVNDKTAARLGLADDDWVWVESRNGKIRCQMRTMAGCEENTVWTWNAIGKMSGAWGLKPGAAEATNGFLLNHLISESLPKSGGERSITNSDPITGQAAWYDLKVRLRKAAPGETGSWPQLGPLAAGKKA